MMNHTVYRARALVIGSGCAGWAAALHAQRLGVDTLLLTQGLRMGTSHNTGSDKQTYYKLSLAGQEADSVMDMAQDLFAGGGMDGDIALCMAAGSARAFFHLCELGVPFPTDAYGQYAGYQTDHDQRRRATSAGPLTSQYMARALERAGQAAGVRVLDQHYAVELLMHEGRVRGVIAVDIARQGQPGHGLVAVIADHVVLATGGSACCYRDSVFPESQHGMMGLALQQGAQASNLHQWQYGLASTSFRWNVSGTYQQVVPRYVSVGEDGHPQEFLADALGEQRAMELTFLKGYEWPFDAAKAQGSSQVDLLVHREMHEKGRRVYLDYRQNPRGWRNDLHALPETAREYLAASGATQPTPFARLMHMNAPAVALYRDNGIDLEKEPLPIAVCAQHLNGGLQVDEHWRTTLPGLYAVGECAGTFGVRRPGGSALNATQVGAQRAAEHIARQPVLSDEFTGTDSVHALAARLDGLPQQPAAQDTALHMRAAMSRSAAFLRDVPGMETLAAELRQVLKNMDHLGTDAQEPIAWLAARDQLITQQMVLDAMLMAARAGLPGTALVQPPAAPASGNLIVETWMQNGEPVSTARPATPIPDSDLWFENVWRAYRQRNQPTT